MRFGHKYKYLRGLEKKYYELTEDQKARGVVFSSKLVDSKGVQAAGCIWEVFNTMDKAEREVMIERVLDDSFFQGNFFGILGTNCPWNLNIIRS